MSAIKNNTSEYRIWLRRRNEKNLIRRTKKRQSMRAERARIIKHNTRIKAAPNYNVLEKRTEFEAPRSFSFVDNPDKTIDFFRTIIENTEKIGDILIGAACQKTTLCPKTKGGFLVKSIPLGLVKYASRVKYGFAM